MREIQDIKKDWRLLQERFVWEYKVSRTLNRISFTFDEFEQTLHFNSSWVFPQWLLLFFRLSMLLYLLFMLGFDLAKYYRQGFLIYWGVYVTNWTYMVTIIYYFFATTSTIYSYSNNLIGRRNYVKLINSSNLNKTNGVNQLEKTKNKHVEKDVFEKHGFEDKENNNNVVTSISELNKKSNKERLNINVSEIQMVNIDLESQNDEKFCHESMNSLSTTNESPIPNAVFNNLQHESEITCSEKKGDVLGKTKSIFKRYVQHLKNNQFIIKYKEGDGRPYFADEINQKMDNTTTNLNLPLLIRLMWLFHVIALPASFIVAIVYWAMSIISPVSVDEFTFLTFNKHGIIAIALSIDTFITSIPFFISHTFYSFFYCLAYLIFTIVYFILKLPNPQGKDDLGFIYPAINFADPAVAVPCSIGIFVVLFITSNIIWFFAGYSRNHVIDPLPNEDKGDKLRRENHYI